MLALALGALAGVAGQARAQGYSVEFDCGRADGWSAASTGENFAAWRDCGGGWLAGMKTYAVPHNDARTSTGYSLHGFTAPPGTRITGIDWEGHKYFGLSSAGWVGGGWAFKTLMYGDGFRSIDPEAYCYTDNLGACYSGAATDPNARHVPMHEVRGLSEASVGFATQCVASPSPCPTSSDGQGGHNLTRAGLTLSRGRVYLIDQRDPQIKGIGGSASTGGWKRETIDLTVTADDNSGICSIAAAAGGQRKDPPLSRDTMSVKPCSDLNSEPLSWDTSAWADGEHHVWVSVYDAAGRSASWNTHYIKTDNNAPAPPSDLSIDGGEDWSTSNSRTIRWTNPGQGSGSPVAGAEVHLCKTGTSRCQSYGVASTGVVTGVAGFDGPGDYTVRVSLKDQAGNWNPAAASSGVRLKFDDVAPGEAEGTRANGWQNAVERAAYQQHVKMRDDAFTPVSGIKGYSITTDGSAPGSTVKAMGETVDFAINDLPEGVNFVKARAVSGAGVGSLYVDSIEVKVDLSKPTASVQGAPHPAKWQNKQVELVLKGTDQAHLSGMGEGPADKAVEEGAYIAYKIDSGELKKMRGAQAPVIVGGDGEHTITYYAVDFAGNQSDTETVQFKIDRSTPAASAVLDSAAPHQWQRESVTVTLTGDDGPGRSGMDPAPTDEPVENGAHVAYWLNSASVQKARGGSATFRIDGDGEHLVNFYAVDSAGNQSGEQAIRFWIDKTAPTSVVFESQGSDRRRIEVSAGDATSGVEEVQVGLRRIGAVPELSVAARQAKKDPERYRRTKLRGTRRTGSQLVDCRRKRGAAKRACDERRRRQLRIASLGEDWTMLPATREGDRWVAYVPNDHSLRMGTYQLQAVAQDQAGNEASGDRFRDGRPAIVVIAPPPYGEQPDCCLPPGPSDPGYRGAQNVSGRGLGAGSSPLGDDPGTIDTKVAAGAVRKVKVKVKLPSYCKKPRTAAQKKKCAKARKPRYRHVFVSRLKVAFGKKAKIAGVLTTAAGAPIADGTLDVITLPNAAGQVPQAVGAVTTDRAGAFKYTAPAGSSRKVTLRFRGLSNYRRSEGNVDLLVPGSATLKASKRQVDNGQSVGFSGRLLGKPLPARGKVVDLQVFYRGKWRTFATPRASKKGKFKFQYRFEATRSTTTYKFRARLRAESAYPYELGYSKVVSVRVRGR